MVRNSDLVVRRYDAADLPAVLDLFSSVAAEGRFIGMELPLNLERLATVHTEDAADANAVRLVATVRDAVVGELSMHVARGRADLGMLIDPSHRGRGIGTELLTQGIAWTVDRADVHKITLQVWPHNVIAQALYRKFGFVVEGYLHHHWRRANGELWDAIVMGLLL